MKKENKIKQYKNENDLNLEKIIIEYSGYIYKIIENTAIKNLSKEDIEEIISDTFFVLWKNKEKLEGDKILSSYIAGIVRNLIREKTRVIKISADISDYENIIPDCRNIDMLYQTREKVSIIEKTVKQMKEKDIQIFNLYYNSSMKISEIAKFLNIYSFNVKTKLYRIRKKIKKELEEGGYSENE